MGIQVRSIYDEAWCECTHDLVYKARSREQELINDLKDMAQCLAQQTRAAGTLADLMYDKVMKTEKRKFMTGAMNRHILDD